MTGNKANNIPEEHITESTDLMTGGFCRKCGREHVLGPGSTRRFSRELMRRLEQLGTIDLFSAKPETGTTLVTAPLFGPDRGKMFGVLECLKPDGTTVILYAFSGQFNGIWLVDGWAPPLFAVDDFLALCIHTQREIKELGREIGQCPSHSDHWLALRRKRRLLSRKLMSDIHGLYKLTNFRGETTGLEDVFIGNNGIPTGTGDCCAPKLLNFAAQKNLLPLGISEFYWGRENRSNGHQHAAFASSCVEKCRPILGFMLCGLDGRP